MLKDASSNWSLQRNLSQVWLVKIRDGQKMSFSWSKTLKVSLVMYYWQVSLSLILVHSQQDWDNNCGEITGYQTSRTKPFQWLKELIHWKFCLLKQLKPDGKMKVFLLIQCHSKTHQLSHHAQDGHYWSTHNFKVQTGSEVLKVTTYLQLTSIKSIGWESSPKTFHKVVLCF